MYYSESLSRLGFKKVTGPVPCLHRTHRGVYTTGEYFGTVWTCASDEDYALWIKKGNGEIGQYGFTKVSNLSVDITGLEPVPLE
ncbi:MAG: hypothetical protein WDN10_03240 [bacterium]